VKRIWGGIVKLVTGEWILDWLADGENGGGVILARALWTGGLAYAVVLGMLYLLGERPEDGFRELARDHAIWLAGTVGGSYASLHARYSSQWSYLAGLYNQIKNAEVSGSPRPDEMARWKLGFLEDAYTLHLAMKPLFASIVAHWGHDTAVRQAMTADYADKGRARLLTIIDKATTRYEEHYGPLKPPESS
jgi:hypothetical protein